MRILLAANASYEPPRGGSTRSNLGWLRQLAARGHAVDIVSLEEGPVASTLPIEGMTVHRIPELARNASALRAVAADVRPDWLLVSSEDLSHRLLREAFAVAPGRVVYLAHTPQFFPFGPESWHRDPAATELVRRARAIVTISRAVDAYVRAHLDRGTETLHPPVYGPGPYRDLADFRRRAVLLMNPCDVKGLPLFLDLAARLPEIPFLALAGWGTGQRDRAALSRLANVRVLEPVPRIEEALGQASVVLMPSLWFEGFGLAATEAMLRGFPVLAADYGGLREAMAGTGLLLPVHPIAGYEPAFDDRYMPRAVVPVQDIAPWERTLRRLLDDPEAYADAARRCRESALRTLASIPPDGLEPVLISLPPVRELTDAQRQLLEQRLAEKRRRTGAGDPG